MMSRDSRAVLQFMKQKPKKLCGDQLSEYKGWRSSLLLQFQPQFQITIITGILAGFIISMVDVVYVLANEKISIEFLQQFCKIINYSYRIVLLHIKFY